MTQPLPQPTLQELMRKSTSWLETKGITNARRETEWIFSETLELSRLELYTRFEMPLEPAEVSRLRELVARRGKREPLAYVLGNQPFRSLRLKVSPAVLVPRPETEELIDLVLKNLPESAPTIVDVGTGSGAIALALKHECPRATVSATDVSTEALAIARSNAQTLTLDVSFYQGHLAHHLSGPYDAIVANLPYVGETERADCDPETAHEPAVALFSGDDGLTLIRELIADAPRLLSAHGILWLEHGWRQGPAIVELAKAAGLVAEIIPDSAEKPRFARLSRA